MPYFVYAVRSFARLQQLGEHTVFRDASLQAKALRSTTQGGEQGLQVRVMFAATAIEAEDLLLQTRERGPAGDD